MMSQALFRLNIDRIVFTSHSFVSNVQQAQNTGEKESLSRHFPDHILPCSFPQGLRTLPRFGLAFWLTLPEFRMFFCASEAIAFKSFAIVCASDLLTPEAASIACASLMA
jgi:hypothetical protein